MERYTFIDLEATGRDPSQAYILQIVAHRADSEPFAVFVETPEPVPDTHEAWNFVGFDREKYEDAKRPLGEALKGLLEYLGDKPLAGHNILTYDIPLLERWLQEFDLSLPQAPALDTLRLAHLIYPTPPDEKFRGYALGDLYAYFFESPLEGAHDALVDVTANRMVAEALQKAGKKHVPAAVLTLWAHLGLEEARFLGADHKGDPSTLLREVQQKEPDFPWIYSEGAGFPSVWQNPESYLQVLGSVREPQIEMMRKVHEAFRQIRSLIVQAPTGTGKTRGYLFPALHLYASPRDDDGPAPPTIVATHTKVLQAQAIRELERIKNAGYRVSAVNIKSARDYLCLEALTELFTERQSVDEDERAATGLLLHYAYRGGYDLEALPVYWYGRPGYRAALFKVRTNPKRCGDQSREHRNCAYRIDLEKRKRADVWVTNQAWLLAHYGGKQEAEKNTGDHFRLVIDEAHNLEYQATSSFTRAASGEELLFHLLRLYNPQKRSGLFRDDVRPLEMLGQVREEVPDKKKEAFSQIRNTLVPAALEALEAYSGELAHFIKQYGRGDPRHQLTLEYSPRLLQKKEWPRLLRSEEKLVDRLWNLYRALVQSVPKGSRLWFRVEPILEFIKEFRSLIQERTELLTKGTSEAAENYVYEALLNHEGVWMQMAQPIDVSVFLKPLWERAKGLVLTSATLDLGDDFKYVKRVLDLEEAKTLKLKAVLPYDKAHLIIPTHLPEARGSMMKRFSQMLHEELKAILPHAKRSLTLFTANQRLREAKEALEGAVSNLYAPLTRKEREDVARAMADGAKPGHALGSRSFMEGVDFPDLKLVSLERIPFPVPSLLLAKRGELAESYGLDPWQDVYLPQAMLSFVQAFGRLIRDDRKRSGDGAFVLWDKRITNALYQTNFFNALPAEVQQRAVDSRDEFYDALATILGVERSQLPQGELLDTDLKKLLRIRESSKKDLEKAIEIARAFWDNLDLTQNERGATQLEGIDAALKGENLFVFLPTGYGKSLIFQVPALVQGGLTVVISPLKALMYDQVEKLRDRGIPAARVDSSMPAAERQAVYDEVRTGRINLLYTSPERLNKDQNLKKLLNDMTQANLLRRFVFDEAHCIVEWGHDFRPDYLEAAKHVRKINEGVPITALTATAPLSIRKHLAQVLGLDPGLVKILERSHDRPEIRYYTFPFQGKDAPLKKLAKLTQILEWLDSQDQGQEGSTIIYVATRRMAERLAWALRRLGFETEAYHAGLSDVIRAEVQGRFEEGKTSIVVATNAFGMGIDKSNVRAVIHFDPPQSLEAYLQESGRAGRDRRTSYAVLLHAASDWRLLKWIAGRYDYDENHLDGLRALLSEGAYWGYRKGLVQRINEVASPDEESPVLEPEALDNLLSQSARYELVRYEYKPGRIGIALDRWEKLEAALEPEALRQLHQVSVRNLKHGALVLDMTRIPPPEAERLADQLYRLWREKVISAFVYWEPALYVQLGSGGEKERMAWRSMRRSMRKHAEERIEAMKQYANTNVCKRDFLMGFLGEEASSCSGCGVCGKGFEPWALGRPLDLKAIEHAYRPDEIILQFFKEVHDRGRKGLGLQKTVHALRGETRIPKSQTEWETLPLWIQHCAHFGRLTFVREKEIKRAIEALVEKGLLQKTLYKNGHTYIITDAGMDALTKMARRRLRQDGVVA